MPEPFSPAKPWISPEWMRNGVIYQIFPDRFLEFLSSKGVTGGSFTAIGAMQHARIAFFDIEAKEYRDQDIDQQAEVLRQRHSLDLGYEFAQGLAFSEKLLAWMEREYGPAARERVVELQKLVDDPDVANNQLLWYLAPLMIPIEIIGHCARVLSLTLRLFGNIMGEDLVLAILLLLAGKFLAPLPMMFLAVFTSTVQAFIFTLLSMMYFAGSMEHAH